MSWEFISRRKVLAFGLSEEMQVGWNFEGYMRFFFFFFVKEQDGFSSSVHAEKKIT